MDLDDASIAWAAGLYEGEGHIRGSPRGVYVVVQMTDPEPLQRMHELFDGHFRGPIPRGKHKPQYVWKLSDWENVQAFCSAVRLWLSPRRITQMDDALAKRVVRGKSIGIQNRWPEGCPSEPIATNAFYARHRARGERPCEVCRLSLNLYHHELRQRWGGRRAPKVVISNDDENRGGR